MTNVTATAQVVANLASYNDPGNAHVRIENLGVGASIGGDWALSTHQPGFHGEDFYHDRDSGKGVKSFSFTSAALAAGTYEVFMQWPSAGNFASNVPVDIEHDGGTTTRMINQKSGGGAFHSLGSYSFTSGTGRVTIRTDGTNGFVVADAVLFEPVPVTSISHIDNTDPGASQVGSWGFYGGNVPDFHHDMNRDKGNKTFTFTPNLAVGGEYEVKLQWASSPNRATNVPVDIHHDGGVTTVIINQQVNGRVFNSLGTYSFSADTGHVSIRTDETNGFVVASAVQFVGTPASGARIIDNRTATGVRVKVEEDRSIDQATWHPTETISYVAISGVGRLSAQRQG